MTAPPDRHYTREHEWLRMLDESTALIGITDYAQNSLGDITFVELPKVGTELKAGATLGVVESVKAASDLFAPVDATVLETNSALTQTPETINQDPYEKGWMMRVTVKDCTQIDALLSAEAYAKLVAG